MKERFDESLQMLCYCLGWLPAANYERRMVSPSPTRIADIPPKTRGAVLERNQLDLELYNFALDLFNERYHAMVDKLIEKSYEDHFLKWNPPCDRTEIYLGQSIRGNGWYPIETRPDGKTFTWLGPQTEAFIDVSLPRNYNLSVTVEIPDCIHSDLLRGFKFFVNGTEVQMNKISGDNYSGIFQGLVTRDLIDLNPARTRLLWRISS